MKNIKVLLFLLILAFLIGCSGLTTQHELGFQSPELKNQPRIVYPEEITGENYKGVSEVSVEVSQTGTVENVALVESSGYDELDVAALDYCRRMEFIPARENGEPISCKVFQKVNFNKLNETSIFEDYIEKINILYRLADNSTGNGKSKIQQRILAEHAKFVQKMGNTLSFNNAIENVLLTTTNLEWSQYWGEYPLTFLLYHDFIQRYPQYDRLDNVIASMQKTLRSDIEFLTKTKKNDLATEHERLGLVVQIQKFVKKLYPKINLEIKTKLDNINS